MRLRNVLHQRQAQAAAFRVVYQRIARPVKLLEDLRLIVSPDANAVILHLELHHAVFTIQLHAQEFFMIRILQRVVNQVHECARDCFTVKLQRRQI